jgi:hypothetical protein
MPLADALFLPDAAAPSREAATPDEAPAGVPPAVFAVLGVAAVLGLLTQNAALTAACIVVLALLVKMLWRAGEPPVLLFAIGYQWVQVTAKVFHADVVGVPIEALSASPSIAEVTWLSLIGLLVLGAGMWIAIRRLPLVGVSIREGTEGISVGRAFWLYVAAAVYSVGILAVAWSFGSVTQILIATSDVKWAAFFLLAYLAISRREGLALFALAFAVELLGGIGYFAGFKTVFFVALLAALASRPNITTGTVATGVAAVVGLVALGSAWTIVKPAFRSDISEGGQGSSMSQTEQVSRLFDAVGGLGAGDLVAGLDPMFERLSYTEYFALTRDYVPAVIPFERGALWGAAVKHVAQPRVFFPDKPRLLSDSEVTMRYTGQYLASDAEGTSISIGYMGETYVDFGPVGMFGVILALGLMWGLMFAHFVRRARVPVLGFAFSLSVLMSAYQFEMASVKILGGVIMSFIVMSLAFRYGERALASWGGAPRAAPGGPPPAPAEPGVDYAALA